MIVSWLLFACVLLATRLCYLPNDRRLPKHVSVLQYAAQLTVLLILFEISAPLLLLLAFLGASAVVIYLLETSARILGGFRLLSLAWQLFVPLALMAWLGADLAGRFELAMSQPVLWVAVVLLMLLNEANYLIRLLFDWCNVVPKKAITGTDPAELDEDEYKAGRVIGMLERTIILLLIYFTGDFGSVGFVLAAKGLIRLRQLRDRQFSEYILIGTLASVLCALVGALFLLWINRA